jgi:superfamily II DNA or RNA helicase
MVIELPELYTHQVDMVDRLRKSIAKHRAAILQAPPGTGKTVMAKWMLGAAANREPKPDQTGKSLFAVHRRGLVDNASNSFNESPALPHGILMSGVEHNANRAVQVASIDTLLSWFCEGGDYNWDETFDLVVMDETHSHFSKLQTFLAAHNKRRLERGLRLPYIIGLTATPQAQGLADIYQEIVRGPETQWLIDQGFLSPYRYFRATQGKLGLLVKRGDEYTKDSVCSAMEGLSGDLVRDWKKFAEGRATVGFFPRRTHAKEAQEALCAAGVKAEYVDGETDDDRRRSLYKWLNNGDIDYLCNVGVVERGTDIPRVGCVQMCTAVGNVVRWLQMIGRGSRVHPEVPDCLVIDHGGGIAKHGFFEDSILPSGL